MIFTTYQLNYAKRHHIPVHLVASKAQLELAAFLEYQVATGVLTVPDARRRYVNEYPEANRLAVGRTVIDKWGVVKQDEAYAFGSVLNLIQPYDDSIREIQNIV